MNRDIKFKTYDKYDKKIYKVESINFNCFGEIKTITVFENDSLLKSYNKNHTSELCNINALVLMQYTGLKDKNGVEIYEGDIVKFVRNFSKYKCSKNYEFEVYFNTFLCHYALHILDDDSNSYGKNGQFDILTLTGAKVKDLEVIGNIFDKEVE